MQWFSQSSSVTPSPSTCLHLRLRRCRREDAAGGRRLQRVCKGTFCAAARKQQTSDDFNTLCESFLFVDVRQKIYPLPPNPPCPSKQTAVLLCWSLLKRHCKFAEAHADTLESPSVTMAVATRKKKTKKHTHRQKNTVGIQLILNKMVI